MLSVGLVSNEERPEGANRHHLDGTPASASFIVGVGRSRVMQ